MPAPDAVPCCVSADEGWLQAGTVIIEKNVNATMSVTNGSLLKSPQRFTCESSLFFKTAVFDEYENGHDVSAMGYNKFAYECKAPAAGDTSKIEVMRDPDRDPALSKCRPPHTPCE